MNISVGYYIYFWLINSTMAFGSGFIFGLIFCRGLRFCFPQAMTEAEIDQWFLYISLIVAMVFFFIYQFILATFIWGSRRGELEFSLLEKGAEHGNQGPELAALLKKIKSGVKLSDADSPHEQLKAATTTYTRSVVVHFKYAVSCEKLGLDQDAIAAYERTLALLPNSADALRRYVEKNLSRVRQQGSSGKPGTLSFIVY